MTDPSQCHNMQDLRRLIDDIDRRLVAHLTLRQRCIDRAIELKPSEGLPARIEDRVEDVVSKVRKAAEEDGWDAELAETLWRQLIEWSIAREEVVLGSTVPNGG